MVSDLVAALEAGRVATGDLVGLTVAADGDVVVAADGGEWKASVADVAVADEKVRPRWVVWSQETARELVGRGVRVATCWDVAATHRLLFGGWRAEPAYVWACLHGQAPHEVPALPREPDLFSTADDAQDVPVLGAPAALEAARLQLGRLEEQGGGTRLGTARSESTAELLCAELSADGLSVALTTAEELLAEIIGPRPRGPADAAAIRAARDARVLRHAPDGAAADLRSPVQVKSLLAAAGIDVPDTRAGRLEQFRERSPLVAALLDWRKAERIATTYGYAWLDEHLGSDGRLRGAWTGADGAAGRVAPDDRVERTAQHARRAPPGGACRGRSRVRPGRPRADRAASARRGVRR